MNQIDFNFLDTLEKSIKIKETKSFSQRGLIVQFRNILDNMIDFVKNLKVCETVAIIRSYNNWMNVKSKFNNSKFKIRDIVDVDLGVGYGYEMSYKHPCIVLNDSNDGFCLIVPCSTGKYGKHNKYIIDGECSDGFKYPTGVLIDSMKCISKTRISNKVGEITVPFLDKLNNIILGTYFERNKLKIRNLERDLKREKEKNILLMSQLEKLVQSQKIKNTSLEEGIS